MKKSVIIAFVLTLLLLLSGCDAILEMMYPEFGEAADENTDWDTWNVVDVSAQVDWWTVYTYGDANRIYPFVVELIDGTGTYDYQNQWMDEWDFLWTSFEGMPDGDYYINIYWDLNDDGDEDWDEPYWYSSWFTINANSPIEHPRWVEVWMDLW